MLSYDMAIVRPRYIFGEEAMTIKARIVCVCVLAFVFAACGTTALPPALISPTSIRSTPTPDPCLTTAVQVSSTSINTSTSTTFNSPVIATPLAAPPTASPEELATREAAVLKANPGPPTTSAATVGAGCPTPTPAFVEPVLPVTPANGPGQPSGG